MSLVGQGIMMIIIMKISFSLNVFVAKDEINLIAACAVALPPELAKASLPTSV